MKLECPLLLIDYQEKLLPHIFEYEKALNNAIFLAKSLNILSLPVIYTEQNPDGLGRTVKSLSDELKDAKKIEKFSFSCACEETDILQHLEEFNRGREKRVIVAGIESHVCVFQTVYDLIKEGYEVFVAKDACGSRKESMHRTAMHAMSTLGACILPVESIVYAAMGSAKIEQFKDILSLVKERPAQ